MRQNPFLNRQYELDPKNVKTENETVEKVVDPTSHTTPFSLTRLVVNDKHSLTLSNFI